MVFPVRLIAGGITLSDVFEQAWDSIVKIDEGMWEEIYAPLLAETAGMGKKQYARHTVDFVPTSFAMDVMRNRSWNQDLMDDDWEELILDSNNHGTGDTGFTMDELMESIMDRGFTMEGANRHGRIDPSFEVNPHGLDMYEGNHRLLALNALGAPHVPFMGRGVKGTKANNAPHKMPLSQEALNLWGKRENYSLADYMTGGSPQIPPSWLYGREMVPGMGRLEPVNRLGEPIDMFTHISETDSNMDSLEAFHARNKREPVNPFDPKSVSRNQQLLQSENFRNKAKWNWKQKPSWKVVFDD